MSPDGMGGAPAGDLASSQAVRTSLRLLPQAIVDAGGGKDGEEALLEKLKGVVMSCQREIETEVSLHPELRGMGTTLTMAAVHWPRVCIAHVGDSRCYCVRKSRLELLTRDHTLARALSERAGMEIAPQWRHVMWNIVGGDMPDLAPEVHAFGLREGDALMLCTDGLTLHVDEDRMAELLRMSESSESACRKLVQEANAEGGNDNITVVVARYREMKARETFAMRR